MIAIKNEIFNEDGGKIIGKRNRSFMNGVAKSVPSLNLFAIKPSIIGIIAAEIINEVNKKLVFFDFFKIAESKVKNPEKNIEAKKENKIAKKAGRVENAFSKIAVMNPPR